MPINVHVFDSTNILTDDELTAIRKNYKRDETAPQNLALRSIAALFSEGQERVERIVTLLYGQHEPTDFIDPIDREVQLLTLFTLSRQWPELAVHCYWSLLLDMTPYDVAMTLLLASLQAGLGEYVSALSVMTKVMHTLKMLAPTEPTPEEVIAQLKKGF